MTLLPAIYFMSDPHIGHKRMLDPDADCRPFPTIEEHDEHITSLCVPLPHDRSRHPELYILGDIAYKKHHLEEFMRRIRPHWRRVHQVRGNHDDKVAWKMRELFDSSHEALYLRVTKDVKVYLSHYAHRVWRGSNRGTYHLHGHSHGALPRLGRSMDVGVNVRGYAPTSITQVVSALQNQPFINHH